ncbi:unnamed protein product [Orchesella dallaii]|uniref:Uncharacterized protein n=1 Tax=Orchesella dallaii TaxID=48710 RepID=A0ABP1RYS5_9HEXA
MIPSRLCTQIAFNFPQNFAFLLIISSSLRTINSQEKTCEINSVPIPCRNDNEFNAKLECQSQPNFDGATSSPCAKGQMRSHIVEFGDFCDPMLWRFGRRKYDDALKVAGSDQKKWEFILGTNIAEDNDFGYSGPCGAGTGAFICPAALCMGVYRKEPDDNSTQFVDMYKFDCIGSSKRSPYEGVCSCGHLWSLIDPLEPYRVQNASNRLVEYKSIKGLNRRLIYDHKIERCAADKYGHCSLDWPRNIEDELKTTCFYRDKHDCVNRSASELGNSIRPVKVKGTGLWYGICDSRFTLDDPFAGGLGLEQNTRLILASFLFLLGTCYT